MSIEGNRIPIDSELTISTTVVKFARDSRDSRDRMFCTSSDLVRSQLCFPTWPTISSLPFIKKMCLKRHLVRIPSGHGLPPMSVCNRKHFFQTARRITVGKIRGGLHNSHIWWGVSHLATTWFQQVIPGPAENTHPKSAGHVPGMPC